MTVLATTSPFAQPAVQPAKRLSLADAIAIALRTHPDARASHAEMNVATSLEAFARAAKAPWLSLNAVGSAANMGAVLTSPNGIAPTAFLLTPERSHLGANLTLMAPVWTGGRIEASIREARARAGIAAANMDAVESQLVLQVKTAYYSALLNRTRLAAAKQTEEAAKETERVAQAMANEGRIAQGISFRAQAESLHAIHEVEEAKNEVEKALIDLCLAMGVPLDEPVDPSDSFDLPNELPSDIESWVRRALEHRPEIVGLRSRIAEARASAEAARSAFKPQVSVMAMFDAGTTVNGESVRGGTVAIVTGFPLLDGGSRRAELDARKEQANAAEFQLKSLERSVEAELRKAHRDATTAQRLITYNQSAVIASEEAFRVAKLRFESGRGTLQERLDAQAALSRARFDLADAGYQYALAVARMERAGARK